MNVTQPSELTAAFSNLRRQNFAVVEFQVSFVEFPQQETKIKAEFTIERKMLPSSNIRHLWMLVH